MRWESWLRLGGPLRAGGPQIPQGLGVRRARARNQTDGQRDRQTDRQTGQPCLTSCSPPAPLCAPWGARARPVPTSALSPQKYYPPDFDPAKIPKLKLPKDRQYVVRLMAPFNMR